MQTNSLWSALMTASAYPVLRCLDTIFFMTTKTLRLTPDQGTHFLLRIFKFDLNFFFASYYQFRFSSLVESEWPTLMWRVVPSFSSPNTRHLRWLGSFRYLAHAVWTLSFLLLIVMTSGIVGKLFPFILWWEADDLLSGISRVPQCIYIYIFITCSSWSLPNPCSFNWFSPILIFNLSYDWDESVSRGTPILFATVFFSRLAIFYLN